MYDLSLTRYLAALLLSLTACVFTSAEPQALPPTATTVQRLPTTLVPTLDRRVQTIPFTEIVTPTETDGCHSDMDGAGTQHTITANLNYTQRALVAQQTSRYTNRTGEMLQTLVFNIEANQWPDAFSLKGVVAGRDDVAYNLTGRRLEIDLPEPLAVDCSIEVRLSFMLDVPAIGGGVLAYRGYLGHSPRQLNLSNWLPVIAPYMDGAWVTREAVFIGEQTVLDMADWDVTLNINAEPDVLDRLVVVGPGDVTQPGARTWRFVMLHSRDFTLSISDAFELQSGQTRDGVTVEVYTFDDAQVQTENGPVDGAAYALDVAIKSVEMFADLFGPYPYTRLAVVQGDFPDGMEFSGVVFVSGDWFRRFTGDPASYLMIITVHEISHQWWYASVGSDQALTPWLDEALATYSEYIFIEEFYPELKDWWWSFRVDNYSPRGFVDRNVYEFNSIRSYINAVYLLGARMLHDLRADLGTEAFFDLLRLYAEAGQGRIMAPDDFWDLLTPDQLTAVDTTRERFFRTRGGGRGARGG
jgi:hypothetical protein